MSKVYVVQGNTGEYSDYREWIVCAYTKKSHAEARVEFLNNLLKEHGLHEDHSGSVSLSYTERGRKEEKIQKHRDGDPDFQCDYTGSSYSYYDIKLIEG